MPGKMEDYFHRLKPNWVELESENNLFSEIKIKALQIFYMKYIPCTELNEIYFSFNLTLEWF